jgi:hypothetical protein
MSLESSCFELMKLAMEDFFGTFEYFYMRKKTLEE